MTTTPTKPSLTILRAAGLSAYPPSAEHASWSPNVTARLVQAMLAYLDEQHAAGQRDYVAPCSCEACTPVVIGSHVFVCADCENPLCPKARDHRNKCSRVEEAVDDPRPDVRGMGYSRVAGAAEAKPEPSHAAPARTCDCGHRDYAHKNGFGHCVETRDGVRCECACFRTTDTVEAPIAEPPSPVAGEPEKVELRCICERNSGDVEGCPFHSFDWCAATRRTERQRDEALAQVEALGRSLQAAIASRNALVQSGDESYHRAEALEKERDEARKLVSKLTAHLSVLAGDAGLLAEARSQLASERAAHEVTMYERDRLLKYCGPATTESASPSEPAPVAEPAQPATPLAPAGASAEVKREILVGSVWRDKGYRARTRHVSALNRNGSPTTEDITHHEDPDPYTWSDAESFLNSHTWVSDPPLAPTGGAGEERGE